MVKSPLFSNSASYKGLARLLGTRVEDTSIFKIHFYKLKSVTPSFDINHLIRVLTPNGDRRLPLIFFALVNDNMEIFRFLLEQGANPNTLLSSLGPIERNRTVLHLAVQRGNEDAVRILLKYNANPNICQSASGDVVLAGATPLHSAVNIDSPVMVNLLLFCKANPNAKLAETDRLFPGATPIFFANGKNKLEIITLLLAHGAYWYSVIAFPRAVFENFQFRIDFDRSTHRRIMQGTTRLHHAALYGELDVMQVLLTAGASPQAYYLCKDGGHTPLYHAIISHELSAVKLLLQSGSSPHLVRYGYQKKETYSSLHIFPNEYCASGPIEGEIIDTLLDWGADPNLRSAYTLKFYPLDFAYTSYLKTCYLLSYGADPFLIACTAVYRQKVRMLIETYRALLLIPSFRTEGASLFVSIHWIYTFNQLVGDSHFPTLGQLATWSLIASEDPICQTKQKALPMSNMSASDYLFFRTKPIVELSKKYQEPALPKL